MSHLVDLLGWWVSVVLPSVMLLSLVSALLWKRIREASWQTQNAVLVTLLLLFTYVPLLPGLPWDLPNETTTSIPTQSGLTGSPSIYAFLAFLGLIWLCGCVLRSIVLVSQWHRLNARFADARLLKSPVKIASLFGKGTVAQLEKHNAEVWICEDDSLSPCCAGILFRRVLLPSSALSDLTPEDRALVLQHELLHFKRGDLPLLYLQRFLEIAYWWNPSFSALSQRLTLVREGQCAEALLESGADPHTYAELLVSVSTPTPAPVALSVGAPYDDLKERLQRIVAFPRRQEQGSVRVALIALVVIVGVSLGTLWFTQHRAASKPQPSDSEVPAELSSLEEVLDVDIINLDREGAEFHAVPRFLRRDPGEPDDQSPGVRFIPRMRRDTYDDTNFSREILNRRLDEARSEVPVQATSQTA